MNDFQENTTKRRQNASQKSKSEVLYTPAWSKVDTPEQPSAPWPGRALRPSHGSPPSHPGAAGSLSPLQPQQRGSTHPRHFHLPQHGLISSNTAEQRALPGPALATPVLESGGLSFPGTSHPSLQQPGGDATLPLPPLARRGCTRSFRGWPYFSEHLSRRKSCSHHLLLPLWILPVSANGTCTAVPASSSH